MAMTTMMMRPFFEETYPDNFVYGPQVPLHKSPLVAGYFVFQVRGTPLPLRQKPDVVMMMTEK
jgi:hypothetical protein